MPAALLTAALLGGCAATPQSDGLATHPPADLPARVELSDTPFWPQQRYQCGPAALATVLGVQGVAATPEQLTEAVYVPGLHGALTVELSAAARRHGMLAYTLAPSLRALLAEVAAGHPVVVLQNLGLAWPARWHFAVAIGYDLDTAEILLRSGTTRRWRTPLSTFERTWARGGRWALVVLHPGRLPVTADADAYLLAVHDLENTASADAAVPAYRAAVQRWPRQAPAWLALGNALFASRDYASAQQAFRQATRVAPDDARGWNNLAYALLKSGCPQQARRAAYCATALQPQTQNYRDTLRDIESAGTGADAPECRPVACRPPA